MVDISIVGAAGEVGRALATHLLRGELIGPPERLQLVGHGREASERKLLAERCDLLDAFDETAPSIQIAATLEEVAGDIIVLAAGATISGAGADRRELAAANRPLFEAFGSALARAGTGQELVIVVTNPVELGVEILSRYVDRHRVLGMGAQQDSLRFARAIAAEMGVRRDYVHAWVCGEHGAAQVPLWSSVRIRGRDPQSTKEQIARLRGSGRAENLAEEMKQQQVRVRDLLARESIREAFDAVEALPPDLRAALEPFVTSQCLHSTPNATANATCEVVRALRNGREGVVGAQVRVDGEFRDLSTTVGLPVLVDASGWTAVVCPPLTDEEARQLDSAAATIRTNLAHWTV